MKADNIATMFYDQATDRGRVSGGKCWLSKKQTSWLHSVWLQETGANFNSREGGSGNLTNNTGTWSSHIAPNGAAMLEVRLT